MAEFSRYDFENMYKGDPDNRHLKLQMGKSMLLSVRTKETARPAMKRPYIMRKNDFDSNGLIPTP